MSKNAFGLAACLDTGAHTGVEIAGKIKARSEITLLSKAGKKAFELAPERTSVCALLVTLKKRGNNRQDRFTNSTWARPRKMREITNRAWQKVAIHNLESYFYPFSTRLI